MTAHLLIAVLMCALCAYAKNRTRYNNPVYIQTVWGEGYKFIPGNSPYDFIPTLKYYLCQYRPNTGIWFNQFHFPFYTTSFYFVLSPMADRGADDMGGLMHIISKSWIALPENKKPSFKRIYANSIAY